MRDLAFIAYLLLILAMGLKRPFLLVLAYVYIDLVSPQRMAYALLASLPVSLICFTAAVIGWVVLDNKEGTRVTWRQLLLVVLLAWAGYTTASADFPIDAADKWDWVWKTLVFAIFLPLTLRTRLRMEALAIFMALSAATIIITGGDQDADLGRRLRHAQPRGRREQRPLRRQHHLDRGDRDDPADPVRRASTAPFSRRLDAQGLLRSADLRLPADPARHRGAHRAGLHRRSRDAAAARHVDEGARRLRGAALRRRCSQRCRCCRRATPADEHDRGLQGRRIRLDPDRGVDVDARLRQAAPRRRRLRRLSPEQAVVQARRHAGRRPVPRRC